MNRQEFAIVNNEHSALLNFEFGVLQGSLLRALMFLIYNNDLSKAIGYSSVHYFVGDNNILYGSFSLTDINEKITFDLSNLVQWFRANKISQNVTKLE